MMYNRSKFGLLTILKPSLIEKKVMQKSSYKIRETHATPCNQPKASDRERSSFYLCWIVHNLNDALQVASCMAEEPTCVPAESCEGLGNAFDCCDTGCNASYADYDEIDDCITLCKKLVRKWYEENC